MGVVFHEPKCPTFTNAGLLDYIVNHIICEDEVSDFELYCADVVLMLSHIQAFRLSNCGSFVASSVSQREGSVRT